MKKWARLWIGFVFTLFLTVCIGQEGVSAELSDYDGASDSWYADAGVTNSTNPTYTFTSTDGETISTDSTGYDATVIVMGNTQCPITKGVLQTISASDWVNASNIRVIFVDVRGHSQDEVAAFKVSSGCDSMYYCYDTGSTASSAYSTYWYRAISKGTTYPLVVLIDGNNRIQSVTTRGPSQEEILAKLVQFAEVKTSTTTYDDTTVGVSVTGTEDYTAAQEMLELLNEQRVSLGLSELVLDEELTEIAMQRAAETAIFYSHTRPDGTRHTSLCSTCVGENVAGQLDTAAEAMEAWQPASGSTTGSNYSNITSTSAKSVGIGCFVDANGNRYWVQYYGSGTGTALSKTGTKQVTREIEVLPFLVQLTTGLEDALELGDSEYVTGMGVSVESMGECSYITPLDASNFTYSSSNTAVVSVDSGGNMTVKSAGTVTLTAVLKADTSISVSQTVTVKKYAATKATVTISGTENYSYAQEILTLVNETRTSLGLSELMLDAELTEAAMQRAAEIAIYYSHTRPDGTSCFTISTRGSSWAENIAAGYTSPSAVMNGWLNSSGHYANIISASKTSIGIGCFQDSDGVWYWVQYFDNATPVKETRTGSAAVTREVSVLKASLDLMTRSNYTTTSSAVGTSFSMPVYQWNSGFSPQLDASNFTFSSSNTSVAVVDTNGKVTIKGGGTAVIKASLTADPNYYASFTVTVNKMTQTVSVSTKGSTSIKAGASTTWKAKTSGDGTITYSTSNSSIATVNSSTGKVTAKGVGTVYIYATASATANYYASSKKLIATITVGLKAPSISSVAQSGTTVTVKWSKVTGASGYYVYRSTSKSSGYTKVKTLSGSSTLSYKDTSSKTNGKTYYYKVYAYSGTTKSAASTAKSVKYMKGTVSSLTNTTSGITIKWSKVSGATGYYIYRKASTASKYTLVTTITKASTVSYTDKKIKNKNGTTYKYYVQPYNSTSKGSYTAKTTVRMTAVSISSLKNSSSKKMTVKWAKNSKATGYQIRYSTSSSFSSYKTITVSGSSSVSTTISSLKKGKTYYVKVRTYKKVSGTSYYSAWSTKKSVKISK